MAKKKIDVEFDFREMIQFKSKPIEEDYKLAEVINRGNNSTVYRAFLKKGGLERAVKVIKKKNQGDVLSSSVINEVFILKSLVQNLSLRITPTCPSALMYTRTPRVTMWSPSTCREGSCSTGSLRRCTSVKLTSVSTSKMFSGSSDICTPRTSCTGISGPRTSSSRTGRTVHASKS